MAISRRLVFVIAASLPLTGCCIGSGCYIQPSISALTSSDGLGPLPKRNRVRPAKVRKTIEAVASHDDSPNEMDLRMLKPYSTEWWTARNAIDSAAEAKLAKKLIICRDCMPSEPDDHTGSIARRRR